MIWELNACFGALCLKVSPPSKPFARWLAVVWRQEKQQGEWLRAGEAFHGSASDLTHHVPVHVSPDLHPCRCTSMLRSTSTRMQIGSMTLAAGKPFATLKIACASLANGHQDKALEDTSEHESWRDQEQALPSLQPEIRRQNGNPR